MLLEFNEFWESRMTSRQGIQTVDARAFFGIRHSSARVFIRVRDI